MTTMAELVDRTLRDWLESAEDQPARLVLTAQITAASTTLQYDPSLIGPEEVETIGPGTLIEVDSEEMVVGGIDQAANRLTSVTRGANGTTAAVHTAQSFIYPRRLWRRRVLFDALADGVTQLFPELYRVVTSEPISVGANFTEVPDADANVIVTPMWFLSAGVTGTTGSTWRRTPLSDGDFFTDFPPSSTGKAFVVPGHRGGTGYLTYKAQFERPTREGDNLEDDFGIDPSWETIIMVSAVAYLVAGRELDLSTQERLSKQLEQQNYPAGTPTKIRDGLLRYRSYLVGQAQDDIRSRYPTTVSMTGVWS